MKTVLIVDDDSETRKVVRLALQDEGYKIIEADDGSMALDLAKVRNPDVIVSDVMMENVNGFMLVELLREDPATEKIPVILITGIAQEAGAWESEPNVVYLQKPISVHELREAVKSMVIKG